jgi:hypothetical protein
MGTGSWAAAKHVPALARSPPEVQRSAVARVSQCFVERSEANAGALVAHDQARLAQFGMSAEEVFMEGSSSLQSLMKTRRR